jgi:hypothetical protein
MRTNFLKCENPVTNNRYFAPPSRIYVRNEILDKYFDGNKNVLFLDRSLAPYVDALLALGVRQSVRVSKKPQDAFGYVQILRSHGYHKRGIAGFDPSFSIDGLEHALKYPNVERSEFVWNTFLIPNSNQISGDVETSTRQSFDVSNLEHVHSHMGEIVRDARWLPDHSGSFYKPSELMIDDLPESFVRDAQLAKQLGMRVSPLTVHARELGVTLDDIEWIKRNRDQFEQWKRTIAEADGTDDEEDADDTSLADQDTPTINFGDALREVFQRPQKSIHADVGDLYPPGDVPNPELRRERVAAEISEEQTLEPRRSERFKRVPTTRWERKDNRARDFLRQEYGGKCQVCGETFLKRDGSPYFEGMYLYSRTNARWIDREGNVLCLCANCCAKLMYGPVEADDILEQIDALKLRREGGPRELVLDISLCNQPARIRFSERHLLDLQELIAAGGDEEPS